MNCVIIQPWFTAVGHPAQSLLNTARVIGQADNICYLISQESGNTNFQHSLEALETYAKVEEFTVGSASLRAGTLNALFKLCSLAMQGKRFSRIFFFDAHLALLAACWSLFSPVLNPERLSMIYLMGPERIKRSRIVGFLVSRFLQRSNVVLYLRTEELVAAWHEAFHAVPEENIRHLPSLELPDNDEPIAAPVITDNLKFGVLGQIRHGKGLDWLVPLFQGHVELGKLTVAGTFNNPAEAEELAFLKSFEGFEDSFLSDEEMLAQAQQQDYLLMLYENWDARMESAVLYLAARANRPVITYGRGWCGRQIRQYGNGLSAPENRAELVEFIKSVPRPGSQGYDSLLAGVRQFRNAHSAKCLRERYLVELMN